MSHSKRDLPNALKNDYSGEIQFFIYNFVIFIYCKIAIAVAIR